jgi:ubiquitin-protein ligase
MERVRSLLVVPNLESPMNGDAANDYHNGTWEARAKEYTLKYAK